MRRSAVVLVLALALSVAAPARAVTEERAPLVYLPPVDAPVVRAFAPPAVRWGAGNRGLDYGTVPGTAVRAAAEGEVVFAGRVGLSLHVVVLHRDGLRTSYSFLASVTVRRGDTVAAGHVVGLTSGQLHFGARAGDRYVDPEDLLVDGPPLVHLVPEHDERPDTEARERSWVERLVRSLPAGAGRAGSVAWRWAGAGVSTARAWAQARARARLDELAAWLDHLRGWAHYGVQASLPALQVRLRQALDDWRASQRDCTPRSTRPPPLQERRLLVLVAGLWSASGDAAVLDVDTASLGYRDEDVMQFSYRGGTTRENRYGREDSQGDLRRAGERLAELLMRLRREHPTTAVDIIGHSQGGLVVRWALAHEYDRLDARFPPLGAVVTLGTPHHGADLATALAMVAMTGPGRRVVGALSEIDPAGIDPTAVAVGQLSEVSSFIRRVNRRPLPEGVRLTSIAARGDVVVPAGRSRLPGAHNVTVTLPDAIDDHHALPGSEEARREIALAVAGLPPTCEPLGDALADAAASFLIGSAEDGIGAALAYAGHRSSRLAR